MRPLVTIEGIENAINNLNYNKGSLKYKLIDAIRNHYKDENSIGKTSSIDTDFLVSVLWNTGDNPAVIKNRRKNFSSIKSSVNGELRKLYKEGKNEEGIIINQNNLFDMSDEAKSEFLESFSYSNDGSSPIPLGKIADVLNIINDFLSNADTDSEQANNFDQLKDLVKDISGKMGISDDDISVHKPDGNEDGLADDLEEIEEVPEDEILEDADEEPEDDEFEEIEGEEPEEEPEDLPEDEYEEYEAEEEDDPGEEVEEIEEVPEDEILEDADGEPEDDEFEEIEEGEPDEEPEDLPEDEYEELEAEEDDGLEDDVEEIEEVPEDEIIEEADGEPEDDEFEEIEGDGTDEEPEEIPGDEYEEYETEEDNDPGEEVEEIEEVPEDEILEEADEEPEDDEFEEIEEGEPEEEPEELQEDGYEELEAEDGEEYTLEEILEDYDDEGFNGDDGDKKAAFLSDEFDKLLSDVERQYNQYILIPGGRYITGSPNPQKNETNQNKIQVREFHFGKYPVTNNLFELFIEKTGYQTTAERLGYGTVYKGRFRNHIDEDSGKKVVEWNSSVNSEKVKGAFWYQPLGPGSTLHGKKHHPVVQVSIEDALAFSAWTGKRLPSEDEWEAGARTGKGNDYPWGNIFKEGLCNIESSTIGDTTPVDYFKKAVNEYGVFDLLGNVLEWTITKEASSERQGLYIAKGGSLISGDNIRLSFRYMIDGKSSSNIIGFRCVAY